MSRHPYLVICISSLLAASPAARAQTPPELYAKHCAVCHQPGINGAPKVGDSAEWTRRVRAGMSMVYLNALQGVPNTAMMAKGGQRDLKDDELKGIVDFMIAAAALSPDAVKAAARYDALRITNREFIRLDADFDGYLSRQEVGADAVLLRGYGRFDADRDGRLNVAEYENAEAALERERMAVHADDETLIAAVRSAIAGVKGIDAGKTKIEARNGNVAIIGIVEEAETALRAYDAVKRIPGIQKIDNRLVSVHQLGWD